MKDTTFLIGTIAAIAGASLIVWGIVSGIGWMVENVMRVF